jgi:hypothetical protein
MTFPIPADNEMDDLPRTLRREKEARLREAREREMQASGYAPPQPEPMPLSVSREDTYPAAPMKSGAAPATVTQLDIPFGHLAAFFIKAVFAAIPAILILMGLLWLFGQALETMFPELLKMKILITFPNS